MSEHKCGYVTLIGRPNAGKSTLLNAMLGSKLAITSSKPQTTRHRIAGIHTDEGMQVVLTDTPGIHKAWTELNKAMVSRAMDTLEEADVVCLIEDTAHAAQRIEAGHSPLDEPAEHIAEALQASGKPVIFLANKMDVVPAPLVLPIIDAWRQRIALTAAVPISALTGDGIERLFKEIRPLLPVGEPLFDPETWTQVSERFLVEELIREKIFHLTEQEIPYATAVEVEKFDETEREGGLVRIMATVVVERPQQKGIVIGKGGAMLKRIGTMARQEIEAMLGCRVFLELFVKVERNWTRTRGGLRRVGFDR